MAGDVATHIEVADFTALYPERCAFTPIPAHKKYGVGYGGDHSEIIKRSVHLFEGLESELRGLPGDVSNGARCVDFISSHPTPDTFTPYEPIQ